MKNERKHETVETMRKAAHDWKKRAKGAEARLVELLHEKVRMQDDHRRMQEALIASIAESDKKLARVKADLDNATDEKAELEYELMCVKAHAYDLAFGSPIGMDA